MNLSDEQRAIIQAAIDAMDKASYIVELELQATEWQHGEMSWMFDCGQMEVEIELLENASDALNTDTLNKPLGNHVESFDF